MGSARTTNRFAHALDITSETGKFKNCVKRPAPFLPLRLYRKWAYYYNMFLKRCQSVEVNEDWVTEERENNMGY